MKKQQQYSTKIVQVQRQIGQIDEEIWRQHEKQQILDQLMSQLDFSSDQSQSSISSQIKSKEKLKISQNESQNSEQKKQDVKLNASSNFSIDTQDLSFQIEKIRLFQKRKHKDEHTYPITLQKEQERKEQIRPKKQTNLHQIDISAYQKKSSENKIQNIEHYHIKDGQKHSKYEILMKFVVLNDQQVKKSLKNKMEEQVKVRKESQLEERRRIREQLLKQRQARKKEKLSLKQQKQKQNQAINNIDLGDHAFRKRIFSQTLETQKQIQKANHFDLNQTLKDFPYSGNKKVLKYTRYIDKKIKSMNKTQHKITGYKQLLCQKMKY